MFALFCTHHLMCYMNVKLCQLCEQQTSFLVERRVSRHAQAARYSSPKISCLVFGLSTYFHSTKMVVHFILNFHYGVSMTIGLIVSIVKSNTVNYYRCHFEINGHHLKAAQFGIWSFLRIDQRVIEQEDRPTKFETDEVETGLTNSIKSSSTDK